MTLYEFNPSRSTRVRWLLQELGLEFDAVRVDLTAGEHRSPEFLTLNPAGKLPVLVDGDMVLAESGAIALYLAEKDPQGRFLAEDPVRRAQIYRWLFFAVTELEQPLWRIARHTRLYPAQRRLPADVVLAREDFTAMAQVLEAHMAQRSFVVPESVSVADFVVAWTLNWARVHGLLESFPNLGAYVERMYARPQAPPRMPRSTTSAQAHAKVP